MIRKHRATESGMSAIPLVVAILLLVAAIVAWYKADQEATEFRSRLNTQAAAATEANKKWEVANNRLLELTEATGYGDAEGKPDKAALQAALAKALDDWRTTFVIEFAADKYQKTGSGGEVEKLPGDKIKVVYVSGKDQITNPTVQQILPIFASAAAKMQNDVKRGFEEKAAEVKSKAEMVAARDRTITEKDASHANTQNEYAQSKRTFEETINGLREQIASKDQALQAAQTELEAVKADAETKVTAMAAQLNQKVAEVKTLVSREQPYVQEGPDGEIVASGSGVAVISLGKKDMVMPGTVFKVLGRIKGGDLVEKGTVKVVVCNDITADCRIIADSASNPITGGDLIQSPVYSPNRTMHFSMVGEFRRMGRAQAEARLKQLGAAIDTTVTSETHYLVTGLPAAGEAIEDTEAYKKAKEFGVTILTEAQLASFTMY